ncbi:uncharacterized protein [Typha latifolia]|uniref:uncharacterized protein n=1 Tax=Typha latifolia TaxID=4733 RepID=UPI003C2D4E4D
MSSSSRRSSGPVLPIRNAFQRSITPSGRFGGGGGSASSTAFASSSSSFSSRSPALLHRSTSPTRVNFIGSSPSSVRLSLSQHRPTSPSRSISLADRVPARRPISAGAGNRRTCMCSPTTHPGSFRCSLHKGTQSQAAPAPSYRLNARRSAMTNSLVRIGTVEGDLVKRALAALIRPSSHQQRRRGSFQSRPSRLSTMSKADDL